MDFGGYEGYVVGSPVSQIAVEMGNLGMGRSFPGGGQSPEIYGADHLFMGGSAPINRTLPPSLQMTSFGGRRHGELLNEDLFPRDPRMENLTRKMMALGFSRDEAEIQASQHVGSSAAYSPALDDNDALALGELVKTGEVSMEEAISRIVGLGTVKEEVEEEKRGRGGPRKIVGFGGAGEDDMTFPR